MAVVLQWLGNGRRRPKPRVCSAACATGDVGGAQGWAGCTVDSLFMHNALTAMLFNHTVGMRYPLNHAPTVVERFGSEFQGRWRWRGSCEAHTSWTSEHVASLALHASGVLEFKPSYMTYNVDRVAEGATNARSSPPGMGQTSDLVH